jgi:hypothetical protein
MIKLHSGGNNNRHSNIQVVSEVQKWNDFLRQRTFRTLNEIFIGDNPRQAAIKNRCFESHLFTHDQGTDVYVA